MSEEDPSKQVGRFLAHIVERNATHDAYSVRFGRGRPQRNFMAKNRLWQSQMHPDIATLAEVVRNRSLDRDPDFMVAITRAIAACCEAGLRDMLDCLEEQERGHREIGFRLALENGSLASIEQVRAGFVPDEDELPEKELAVARMKVDWPRNADGLGACACCGYHTMIEGPCTFEACAVCGWLDVCDVEDPWNTSKWGQTEDPWEEEGGPEWRRVSVVEARDRFARGIGSEDDKSFRREPMDLELPRYDWNRDPRPYCTEETP
ncbi:MAG TPA: hypothetical protein PKE29_10350 [Phycisphaerales bacterium]|nr:hypothetical protein [Phycisphaerales bacterium]